MASAFMPAARSPEGTPAGLTEWFAGEGFRGSFVVNAAAELRGQPDHPAHRAVAEHRSALRQLLADLAGRSGAADPTMLAGQLLVLVDGAIAVAAVDRRPEAAARAGRLASALLEQGSAPEPQLPPLELPSAEGTGTAWPGRPSPPEPPP